MKTKHCYRPDYKINVDESLRNLNIYNSRLRVIESGRGVIILPETDVTRDCSTKELLKALHLPKEEKTKDTDKVNYIFTTGYRDDTKYVQLTQEQIKFLEWLEKEDYLMEDVQFQSFNSVDFIKL